MKYKVGIGYDIHQLVEGRKLILGGVEIPYEKGLDGHSDADVLLHAVCDAILGALGKGDIGEHFPNTDDQYKDISSMDLLKRVNELVAEEEYIIGNIDCVLQAQEPNLKNYKSQMKFHIAYTLALEEANVNVKATTLEEIGALGKREGIAAFATCIIMKKDEE